jgi:fructokinase
MIVVAGESLIDLLVRPDGSVQATPGGGPFNAARALARLGVASAFVGRLSTDRFGRTLREALEADGVDLRWAVATDDPTMLAIAETDDDGSATYRFHVAGTAAAGLGLDDLPAELPSAVVALHVGTLGLVVEPMATAIEALIERAAEPVAVFLDLNVRPAAIRDETAYRARLDRAVRRADVVKASVEDLRWLAPAADVKAAARGLLEPAGAVLVTDGPNPVRLVTSRGVEAFPVPRLDVADTIGAGDAFGAGFLASWTASRSFGTGPADLADWRAATRQAIRVGSATTTRPGADPPTIADLEGPAGPA